MAAGGGIKINNISVRGGADGKTAIFKIENGYLYPSYNNGTTWEKTLGQVKGEDGAEGEKGDTGAKLVSQVLQGQDADGGNIYLQTFDDGTTAYFTAPKGDKGDKGDSGSIDNIVQTTGESTTVAMSQKATTDAINEIWDTINYVAPTISYFGITLNPSVSPSKIKLNDGNSYTLTKITHKETNITNINGSLILRRGSITILSNIAATTTSTTLTVSDTITVSTSPQTYTLSCTDKKGNTISTSISVYGYWTSFIGASDNATISDSMIASFTDTESNSLSGTRTVTTTDGQYVWFITTSTINKVTSSGFEVPITLVNSSYSYNGGTYKCYRTTSALTAGTHTFVIS